MKNINLILRKCKSFSQQLSRSYSYSSLRSKSARDQESAWPRSMKNKEQQPQCETIFVGSTRKRYVVSAKYLKHPLLNALIEKSGKRINDNNNNNNNSDGEIMVVKCEVVLFDHLLWMLENVDQNLILESLEEYTDLYLF